MLENTKKIFQIQIDKQRYRKQNKIYDTKNINLYFFLWQDCYPGTFVLVGVGLFSRILFCYGKWIFSCIQHTSLLDMVLYLQEYLLCHSEIQIIHFILSIYENVFKDKIARIWVEIYIKEKLVDKIDTPLFKHC